MQVAAGGVTGYIQGTSMGFAEDTARSKPLYSLQTQQAHAGQRSAQAFPALGKGLSKSPTLTHFEHSPRQVRALFRAVRPLQNMYSTYDLLLKPFDSRYTDNSFC